MTYADQIARAMSGHGKMNNQQIYRRFRFQAKRGHRRLSPHWKATVRNTLQRHSKQSPKFRKPYLFIHHSDNVWEAK